MKINPGKACALLGLVGAALMIMRYLIGAAIEFSWINPNIPYDPNAQGWVSINLFFRYLLPCILAILLIVLHTLSYAERRYGFTLNTLALVYCIIFVFGVTLPNMPQYFDLQNRDITDVLFPPRVLIFVLHTIAIACMVASCIIYYVRYTKLKRLSQPIAVDQTNP